MVQPPTFVLIMAKVALWWSALISGTGRIPTPRPRSPGPDPQAQDPGPDPQAQIPRPRPRTQARDPGPGSGSSSGPRLRPQAQAQAQALALAQAHWSTMDPCACTGPTLSINYVKDYGRSLWACPRAQLSALAPELNSPPLPQSSTLRPCPGPPPPPGDPSDVGPQGPSLRPETVPRGRPQAQAPAASRLERRVASH